MENGSFVSAVNETGNVELRQMLGNVERKIKVKLGCIGKADSSVLGQKLKSCNASGYCTTKRVNVSERAIRFNPEMRVLCDENDLQSWI
jgi:hypothetical protein